ncbi:MAG: hypothetical protein JKY95_00825, partial [Planctomycetaceae bacterium]|nr:hypothetical protein [Planctomycetaceae bacterium]
MVGSLRKLWPFQKDLTPDVIELKHKAYQNLPLTDVMNSDQLLPVLFLIVLAAVAVLVLERWASGVLKTQSLSASKSEENS